jgi:hypothetical protein
MVGCVAERDEDGSSYGIFEILYRQLVGGTEENHKKVQSGWSVSQLRLKAQSSKQNSRALHL